MQNVLETISQSSVAKAYDSLDPWKALKAATNKKMRLVKIEDLAVQGEADSQARRARHRPLDA